MEQPRREQHKIVPLFHGIYCCSRKLVRDLSKKLRERAAEQQLSLSIGVLLPSCPGQRISSSVVKGPRPALG